MLPEALMRTIPPEGIPVDACVEDALGAVVLALRNHLENLPLMTSSMNKLTHLRLSDRALLKVLA